MILLGTFENSFTDYHLAVPILKRRKRCRRIEITGLDEIVGFVPENIS